MQILTLLLLLQIKEIAESNLGVFDIVKEHEAGSQLLTQVVLSHSGRKSCNYTCAGTHFTCC